MAAAAATTATGTRGRRRGWAHYAGPQRRPACRICCPPAVTPSWSSTTTTGGRRLTARRTPSSDSLSRQVPPPSTWSHRCTADQLPSTETQAPTTTPTPKISLASAPKKKTGKYTQIWFVTISTGSPTRWLPWSVCRRSQNIWTLGYKRVEPPTYPTRYGTCQPNFA